MISFTASPKSRDCPGHLVSDAPTNGRTEWRMPRLRQRGEQRWFVSSDGFCTIATNHRAQEFFGRPEELLDILIFAANRDQQLLAKQGHKLLAQAKRLQGLTQHSQRPQGEFVSVDWRRFEVIARDMTGITFLHHKFK